MHPRRRSCRRRPSARALLLLLGAAAAPAPAAAAGGAELCVLFVSEAFRGFHFGRVDFARQRVVDLLPLPASLTGAGGGVAAGADDGSFYIPNPDVAYNSLLEFNILTNTSQTRTVAPPPAYAGSVPAFYTMVLNVATNDVYALFEESRDVAWVAAATVYPGNGTSVALSADFRAQWLAFAWRKVGVAAVDSARALLYFVAGVGAAGAETLVGVPVGDAAQPVVFVEKGGPGGTSSDIDFLGYSAPLDLLVAACFSINTGVASVKTMPAGGAGGAGAWTTIYTWPANKEGDMELGNGALSADGLTFWVALDDASRQPTYFAFDLTSGKLVATLDVPAAQWPGMITAEVVAC